MLEEEAITKSNLEGEQTLWRHTDNCSFTDHHVLVPGEVIRGKEISR
jgi:hypothetical protein